MNLVTRQIYGNKKGGNAFVSTWKTDNLSTGSSTATQVKLPLISDGVYNFTVNWGDGSTNVITSFSQGEKTHTYSSAGTYVITITGIINGFSFSDIIGNDKDRLKILTVSSWGILKLGNSSRYFYSCTNLNLSTVSDVLDLSGTTNLSLMFNGYDFTTINKIEQWNVSNIIDFSAVFQGSKFDQNIGAWNVSKGANLSYMFSATVNFNNGGSVSINNWVLNSSSLNITYMFDGALKFNQPVGNWNISASTSLQAFLRNAKIFNQDISSLNTANVTDFSFMCAGASLFNNGGSPNMNSWNTAKGINLEQAFAGSAFNQPIGNWNTALFINMFGVFGSNSYGGNTVFNQDLSNWIMANVTTTAYMFAYATNFNNGGSVSINNWNMAKITSTQAMFYITKFNQPIGNWNLALNTNMQYMLGQTADFKQNIGALNVSNVTNLGFFMQSKTPITYPSIYLDDLYVGWASRPVKPNITIDFGTAKYTSASASSRAILTGAPNNWVITDGGI